VGWAVAQRYAAAGDGGWAIKRRLEPEYLLTDGPYRFSRNPMYVGGVAIWGGWAILLGSARVASGLVVLSCIYRASVVWVERMLERQWGDAWLDYATRTSRWLTPVSARWSWMGRK
jgi:protein-S-isoprenylcysteine O-methyltransferase Ste14